LKYEACDGYSIFKSETEKSYKMSLIKTVCLHFIFCLVIQSVQLQDADEYYSRNSYQYQQQPEQQQVNAKTFFQTCLQIRDSNNFFTEEEQFHSPIAPAALPTGPAGNEDLKHLPKFILESRTCTDYR
jgi:hypothetical protein